ncbi:uncharacterized protein BX663DRAFT_506532 [Cokeromyces recurvatus]|uniref:uncharacterized protein n=1 Tax=Cokeromyces recurvatus TaxID=90255 RepID=UPI0022207898|nr:uncharacterized protein BX663DRAFT_506532 [Cokeromyces recurvatus]KAI7903444.1 hypothetical protein BX663DRAFT_506532 [Cokeromyces recurvatus]
MSESRKGYNQRYQQKYDESETYYDKRERQDRGSRYDRKPLINDNGMQKIDDTIYVSNLPQDITEEKLAAYFGSIGIIKTDKKLRKPKIWIYMDKETNLPKGDATITYDDPPSADAAIEWFGGKEFMGNTIQVSKAERKMNNANFGKTNQRGRGSNYRDYDRSNSSNSNNNNSKDVRDGDWTCDSCGANNFSRRNDCFKCHTQKSSGRPNNDNRRGHNRHRPY